MSLILAGFNISLSMNELFRLLVLALFMSISFACSILFILFSATALAKWEGGYLSEDGKMSLYYDNESIDINYPRFRIWSLMDFNSPINKNINVGINALK